jgi:hypothetical protein
MAESSTTTAAIEARRMLDIFASAGARALDLTLTNTAGDKLRFRRNVPLPDLARTMPAVLEDARRHQQNVIVRPHGPHVTFLQLDDLTAAKHQITTSPTGGLAFGTPQLLDLASLSFVIIETSPDSFQAWLAIEGRLTKEFSRRVRQKVGADTGASGATRIPGSLNFKDKYAPDYPRVQIRQAQPGRKTSIAELEELGLVAAPEVYAPLPPPRFGSNHKWPSYGKALDGAPLNSEGTGPDRSKADFVWCMTAITWGFGIGETAWQLMQEDSKARQLLAEPNGERFARAYALLTATKASEAVDRRRPAPRSRIAAHERG